MTAYLHLPKRTEAQAREELARECDEAAAWCEQHATRLRARLGDSSRIASDYNANAADLRTRAARLRANAKGKSP